MKFEIILLLSFYLVGTPQTVIPCKPQSSDQRGSYPHSLHSTALSDNMSNHPNIMYLTLTLLFGLILCYVFVTKYANGAKGLGEGGNKNWWGFFHFQTLC